MNYECELVKNERSRLGNVKIYHHQNPVVLKKIFSSNYNSTFRIIKKIYIICHYTNCTFLRETHFREI